MTQPEPRRQSLVTRNVRIGSGRTSVRLELIEWLALEDICRRERVDRHGFAARVQADPSRLEKTLTSRLRSAILNYYVILAGVNLAQRPAQAPSQPRITKANINGMTAKPSNVDTTTTPATPPASRL